MDFGNSWDGLAKHVVAPVAGHVVDAAGRVKGAVEDTWHGFFGSPTVPGGTNWNGYSHEELQAMLHDGGASPGQVGDQSAVMDGWASKAAGTADEVTLQVRSVPAMWQGVAADNAVTTMVSHAEGGGEVHRHVASIARALDMARAALSRAQHSMPQPVAVDTITQYGAMVGGVGGAAFGPVSSAAGAVAGGTASFFGASVWEKRNMGHAVEVMQRYEKDLQDALAQITPPAKLPPGPDGESVEGLNVATNFSNGRGDTGPALNDVGLAGPATSSPSSATAGLPAGATGASGVSGFDPAIGRSGTSLASVGGPSAVTSAAGSAGSAIGGGLGVGRGFGGGGSSGGGMPWRELTGRGALAGVMPELLSGGLSGGAGRSAPGTAAGRGAGGLSTRGAGGAPGMGSGGRGQGQRGEDDAEHRNKMPQGENLFALDGDEFVPPPVLGDWTNEE